MRAWALLVIGATGLRTKIDAWCDQVNSKLADSSVFLFVGRKRRAAGRTPPFGNTLSNRQRGTKLAAQSVRQGGVKVYSYVIVTDDGGAPNFERPFTTLAICKPKIRLKAEPGDLVLSFTGAPLLPEPHAVRWAGVVKECPTFAQYWKDKRFANKKPGAAKTKPDNIYCPQGSRLVQIPNEKHGLRNVRTDLS
jgi:hypothetical protein